MSTQKERERGEAIASLKKELKRGMTVYTIMRHVSGSGMMRHITPLVFKGNEPYYLTYPASVALGWPRISKGMYDAVKVSGAGMDIGYHLVYSLGQVVFGDGYELKQRWL